MADREARLRAKIGEITRLINEINELVNDEDKRDNPFIYVKGWDKFSDEPNGIHLEERTFKSLYPDAEREPEPLNIFDEIHTEVNGVRVYALTERHAG